MPRISAGIVVYRRLGGTLQFLLVHPGGPFWRKKDEGAWSIPKGEVAGGEALLEAAQREFQEETGFTPIGPFTPLTPVKLKSGKIIHAFAAEGDFDPARLVSNTFTVEWPPGSGKSAEFPEVDRAAYFEIATAKQKINPAQSALIDQAARLARR